MTHGYCMAAVFHARMLPALAQHYRIVLFDNLSWGLNSRVDNIGDALDSAEKAEQWLVSWWHALIETMGTELTIHERAHAAGLRLPDRLHQWNARLFRLS
uniref:Uncharacterized protein n=1 Tax=Favella ehrenbergii TaxID=182087 RepID=A0A7S3MK50_9SPIT|mmetsp:Transcript_15158/g.19187  ORF Transcript_15158/g.19187 Transcript_15158/m.19187 type:complete len:100 (+) Transcript_15158:214-513(+)